MNHSFIKAGWNGLICSKCLRTEIDHSDNAQCESCSNKGPCEITGKLLLCFDCRTRELKTVLTNEVLVTQPDSEAIKLERIVNQVNRVIETNQITHNEESIKNLLDEAIKGNIKQYTDFFNAKIPSILELKGIIDVDDSIEQNDKQYAFAKALQKRLAYLTMVLFETRATQVEMAAEVKSIQYYINELIPNLRMKLRAEFAANTPNYTPQVIKKVTERKGKQSTSDKLAESYARMMKIPIEQAKRLLENKLRDDCTCSITPGICKVHV
jgi:hypothetical protein